MHIKTVKNLTEILHVIRKSMWLLIVLLSVVVVESADQLPEKSIDGLTISKNTTFITEPLDNNGYPDYAAALNAQFNKGVTPDNNAVVLLLRALGPNRKNGLSKTNSAVYFRMLKISPPIENSSHYIYILEYIEDFLRTQNYTNDSDEVDLILCQHDTAASRPWSKKEFPIIADWLNANEESLAMLVSASKRSRYFEPILPRQNLSQLMDKPSYYGPMPYGSWIPCQGFEQALMIRAMERLHNKEIKATWEYLLACHRLARLRGQAPDSEDVLTAFAMDGVAFFGDRILLQSGQLSANDIKRIRLDLAQLSSMPKMADKFNIGERFCCLNWALDAKRNGLEPLKMTLNEPGYSPINIKDAARTTLRLINDQKIDSKNLNWDVVFRTINSCFDHLVAAQRIKTYAERVKTIKAFQHELITRATTSINSSGDLKKQYSERIGLAFFFTEFLKYNSTVAEDRAAMDLELVKLAFALAQYQLDHNVYPVALTELSPTYVTKIPKDIFNGADLHYKQEKDGYLLYSVGVNGKDDGGKTFEEGVVTGDKVVWDDLVVRIPARKSSKRRTKENETAPGPNGTLDTP